MEQMTLDDIQQKRVDTIIKSDNTYWVVLEDGSAVGFSPTLQQIDTATYQPTVLLHTRPNPTGKEVVENEGV